IVCQAQVQKAYTANGTCQDGECGGGGGGAGGGGARRGGVAGERAGGDVVHGVADNDVHAVPQLRDGEHQRRRVADAAVLRVAGGDGAQQRRLRLPHPHRQRALQPPHQPQPRHLPHQALQLHVRPTANNEQLTQNRYVAGPVAFAPALPPLPPSPPETSVQPNSAVDPTAMSPSPPIIQGQRPLLLPSSAWRRAHVSMASVSVVLLIAASVLA
ncbi:Os03g0793900, partial [Oryza sativa Japonica Group]